MKMKKKYETNEVYICSGSFRELHFYAKKNLKDATNTGVVQCATRLDFIKPSVNYGGEPNMVCSITTDMGETIMVMYPFNIFCDHILPVLTCGVYDGILSPYKITERSRIGYLLP